MAGYVSAFKRGLHLYSSCSCKAAWALSAFLFIVSLRLVEPSVDTMVWGNLYETVSFFGTHLPSLLTSQCLQLFSSTQKCCHLRISATDLYCSLKREVMCRLSLILNPENTVPTSPSSKCSAVVLFKFCLNYKFERRYNNMLNVSCSVNMSRLWPPVKWKDTWDY